MVLVGCFITVDNTFGRGFDCADWYYLYSSNKGNVTMLKDFIKKLEDAAARKKADFRLQQEEVARRYDESVDTAVANTAAEVEKYLEKQLNRFEAR